MNKNKDILTRINRRSGMTVPEGYFDDFAARLSSSLPDNGFAGREAAGVVMPRSRWHKMRPYVYLAAMFAGVWCMMKMFSLMSDTRPDLSIEANPILSEALSDETFVNDMFVYPEDEYDLFEDIYNTGISADEFTDSLDEMMYDDSDTEVNMPS